MPGLTLSWNCCTRCRFLISCLLWLKSGGLVPPGLPAGTRGVAGCFKHSSVNPMQYSCPSWCSLVWRSAAAWDVGWDAQLTVWAKLGCRGATAAGTDERHRSSSPPPHPTLCSLGTAQVFYLPLLKTQSHISVETSINMPKLILRGIGMCQLLGTNAADIILTLMELPLCKWTTSAYFTFLFS